MFKRYWWVWALAAIAVAYFVLVIYPHYSRIRMTTPLSANDATMATVQATWFQAIGSVLAIFAAFLIARHEFKLSERSQQLERDRQFVIAKGWLSSALSGVALECGVKGSILAMALDGRLELPIRPERLAAMFSLKSVDALAAVRWTIGHYEVKSGHLLAQNFMSIEAYNRTLPDLAFSHGDHPDMDQSLVIIRALASRLHGIQPTAAQAILLADPQFQAPADLAERFVDVSWYEPFKTR
jgi:hypothetical protein